MSNTEAYWIQYRMLEVCIPTFVPSCTADQPIDNLEERLTTLSTQFQIRKVIPLATLLDSGGGGYHIDTFCGREYFKEEEKREEK